MIHSRLGLADADSDAQLLHRVIEILSAGLDLDAVVQRVADLITETTSTDVCFVHLLDKPRGRLQLRGATPPSTSSPGVSNCRWAMGCPGGSPRTAYQRSITDNKRADPRYLYIPELRGEDFTSMASVPMITRARRSRGGAQRAYPRPPRSSPRPMSSC